MMREGNIYYGEAANLSNCRDVSSTGVMPQEVKDMQLLLKSAIREPMTIEESAQQLNPSQQIDDIEDFILWGPAPVEVDFHYNDADGIEELSEKVQVGQLLVTSEQLIFWMNKSGGTILSDSTLESTFKYQYDLRADATCIDLHALTGNSQNEYDDGKFQDVDEDDEKYIGNTESFGQCGVYLQLSDGCFEGDDDDDDEHRTFQELTFHLVPPPENLKQEQKYTSHTLFAAISKLISLHPIDPNDILRNHNDTFHFPTMGGTPTMWFGEGPVMTADGIIELPHYDVDENDMAISDEAGENDNVGYDDELIVAPRRPPHTMNENDSDNEQQRIAMLERLDRLLIIPPEYEYPENDDVVKQSDHQFDDADDSDNDLL